jgi:hypothetical protein
MNSKMGPKLFDRQYLKKEFEKLNDMLPEHVNFYLIGGGSMSFQKYKTATKDIDIVVRSSEELDLIKIALRSIGYTIPTIRGSYKQMGASAILENTDEFRWDIFVNVICDGLQLNAKYLGLYDISGRYIHIQIYHNKGTRPRGYVCFIQ